jgi:hypothetical protein
MAAVLVVAAGYGLYALLRRPRPEPGLRVKDVPAAIDWIGAHLGRNAAGHGKELVGP